MHDHAASWSMTAERRIQGRCELTRFARACPEALWKMMHCTVQAMPGTLLEGR
jgi:hypothetical protein